MSTKLHSGQIVGLSCVPIEVEIDLAPGLHHFSIVGLPDKAVDESKERVSAAIKNSGFRPPQKKNHRVTVNLAPADLHKEGALFDLPIALAYLNESGQISFDSSHKYFLGELALSGIVRPVRGVLALVRSAKERGFREIFVPRDSIDEARLVNNLTIYPVASLREAVQHLDGTQPIKPAESRIPDSRPHSHVVDFSDIKGQEFAKRGIEIAASGNHHAALIGPPGTGKTMLARALQSILPPLTVEETLEITAIHSIAGTLNSEIVEIRPFRNPHHTASYVSLVGGGTYPKPGEVTLAHKGVLFLDEFPEFDRRVIETLRQPLEDRVITISRARKSLVFPADIVLVAAMNTCPCGNRGTKKACSCSPRQLHLYARKISGPILDRIDMWLPMPNIDFKKLSEDDARAAESSETVRKRVLLARKIQSDRFSGTDVETNSHMGTRNIKMYCTLNTEGKTIMENALQRMDLSARAYHRVLKVARTIADIAHSQEIKKEHLFEAIQYRPRKELFF